MARFSHSFVLSNKKYKFMIVKSFSAKSTAQLTTQIGKTLLNGYKPTLCILFTPFAGEIGAMQSIFSKHQIDLIGCTSAGEIQDDQVFDNAIVCMLLDIEKTAYTLFAETTGDSSTYKTAFNAGLAAKEAFENPGMLLLSGGIAIDAEQLVYGVKDAMGREIPFYGGLAADAALTKTISFSNDFNSEEGIVCLIFDTDKVEMKGMATSGWEAIGGNNIITEAKGNVVYSINDEPALDVFLKYFGFFDNTMHNGAPISSLSAQYPLQLQRNDGASVLRSPTLADNEDRTLILAGGVKTGENFRFSIAPGFNVVEQTVAEFSNLHKETEAAEAAILFSCKGRHAAFGPIIEDEVSGLYNHWNVPMIGFFTFGEIGNASNGVTEFHNETCSMVVLREK
jgi:hypothetical protein